MMDEMENLHLNKGLKQSTISQDSKGSNQIGFESMQLNNSILLGQKHSTISQEEESSNQTGLELI